MTGAACHPPPRKLGKTHATNSTPLRAYARKLRFERTVLGLDVGKSGPQHRLFRLQLLDLGCVGVGIKRARRAVGLWAAIDERKEKKLKGLAITPSPAQPLSTTDTNKALANTPG